MKFSIIIPVYNSAKYIHKAIESIVNQTYDNYELILVDDGSTDHSYEILKEWSNKNKKIKVYQKDNTGPGFTRKYGFEKSSGELLFFVDSDDWLPNNNVLKEINDIFINNDIDILFFDKEDIVGEESCVLHAFEHMKPGYHLISDIQEEIRPQLGTKVLKRQFMSSDLFIESKVYEDLYTTYMYLDQCKNFLYTDQIYYTLYHDINSNSLSSVHTFDDYDTYKKAVEIVLKINDEIKNKDLLYSLYLRMPILFIKYSFKYKKRVDEETKINMDRIIDILNKNKVSIDFKCNNMIKSWIKNLYYKIFVKIEYLKAGKR